MLLNREVCLDEAVTFLKLDLKMIKILLKHGQLMVNLLKKLKLRRTIVNYYLGRSEIVRIYLFF